MEFEIDKIKAVEAIVLIAARLPGAGRFHVSKALYFAELYHLKRYGRPIFGDRYIAMDNGPVPSFAYDLLKGTAGPVDQKLIEGALSVDKRWQHPRYHASRPPDAKFLSKSDIEALDDAVAHVKGRSFGSISDETHAHSGWKNASLNTPMKFDDMLEGADPEVIESAEEFAAYGVL